MEIDLIYTWVDGNDPKWRLKHDAFTGKDSSSLNGKNCEGRFADNDELKFSLRSVEKYAPWIRKIYIVTDAQVPSWLDTSNTKIQIIDHKEILPSDCLPTFNSDSIEHALYKIPGLSEWYIYANDDTFLNREVSPSDFFTPDGRAIIRLNWRPLRRFTLWFREKILRHKTSNYNKKIQNAARLIQKHYGRYFGSKTHHNIDAYIKSSVAKTAALFEKEIAPTLRHHVRDDRDINRNLYSYAAIAEGKGVAKFVNQKTSFRLHTHKHRHYEKLERYNPVFFCINDSQFASDNDRIVAKEWLEKRFPAKSCFEK